ncbi:Phosphoglycerate dehydrogenase [Quadrisphaera granulorum]|uniref:Phosphoglycerate dehydrogenase-like enzyme n=1 Tax=Quadrisphaera granulorum TaxID=317664 RepID=A0A316A4V6_9ACTN|nr:NAD(P)-dependent oxidoreductase [Quadrisphaera granulorum]PWJ52946.1 phosphoglycerate dehydrogenase-like enzyme [Quadrisphaera granulorum]SZE97328.1 Phosphoglycerate dehydrogenase [Quadrisphaera granulorum]
MRIVVIDPNLPAVAAELEEAARAAVPGTEVSWHPRFDKEAVARDLPGAEVLVASRYTASLTPLSGSLRLLQCPAAGLDAIDTAALPAGVLVANTGHHERSVAEHVLAGVVVLRRRLREQDAALRERSEWASSTFDSSLPLVGGLDGARIGFVGFGAIGRACWAPFAALGAVGAAVTGSGSLARPDLNWPDLNWPDLEWHGRTDGADGRGGLDRLVAESDVLVLSAPLTPATTDLVDARVLGLAPADAVLVNVGRGPLVNEDALFEALAAGRLGGAVLDVWWTYPGGGAPGGSAGAARPGRADPVVGAPGRRDWGSLANVVASPHSSGITRQTLLARVADIAENLSRLEAGTPLLNAVGR